MRVAEIDVYDDAQVRAFWEAGQEGDAFGRPYAAYSSLEATAVALRDNGRTSDHFALMATEGVEVLGMSAVMLPKLDNTHLAYVETIVRPAHRRRGVGTALLEASLTIARERDRTTVMSEVNMPFEMPPASAGSTFLERHGFTTASLEIHRVLGLPVDDVRLDALGREAALRGADYRLVSFTDRVPDEFLEGFCALQSAFNSEAPLGELDLEPERWDETRVRDNEARSEKMGRRLQATVALGPAGDVVAITEMVTSRHTPETGWQSGTLVLSAHRGHRLGMAIKVANLRRFQETFPSVVTIHSWNAEENGPMVAINDTIGFRPVEYVAEMQRRL